nr:MAG TPA: hypothetical protein [Bacteriophage sp.]
MISARSSDSSASNRLLNICAITSQSFRSQWLYNAYYQIHNLYNCLEVFAVFHTQHFLPISTVSFLYFFI